MAKVGRPARISREAIAEAANEIGLSHLTLRAVAEHLGVSIPSLYHHVASKDDLMRLAAEYSAARSQTPEDRDQHWAVWLLEWAIHNRDAFLSEPPLVDQFLDGAISADVIAENTNAILGLLVRQGFSVTEAQSTYQLVSACAIGSAIQAIRAQREREAGRPASAEYKRVLDQSDPDALPHLRSLLSEVATAPLDTFPSRMLTVLAGIAARRGEPWEPIAERLERLHTAHS